MKIQEFIKKESFLQKYFIDYYNRNLDNIENIELMNNIHYNIFFNNFDYVYHFSYREGRISGLYIYKHIVNGDNLILYTEPFDFIY